jgi:23S rRNA (uracil1939-C5)-methyltransferase
VNQVRKPRYGDEFVVAVERLDERGRGIGRAQHESGSYRVALERALPGETVRAAVLRRRKERIDARALETLRVAPERVEPRCQHFDVCGGCTWQHASYAAQLRAKRELVVRALRERGLDAPVDAVEPCAEPWRYRNKMDFTFGAKRWVLASEVENAAQGFALGLHPRGQFRKVLDVESCSIQFERGDLIVRDARRLALERGLDAWDVSRHVGLLRHLVLRESRATGEILAQLTTSEEAPDLVRPYAEALRALHPEITTLVQAINTRGATIATGERDLVLAGSGTIRERLAGLWFRISANSFFQTNTRAAERLVELVLAEAAPTGDDVVLDLYCGAGSLSLPLARAARRVVGVEWIEAAVQDARANAAANEIVNVEFASGDVRAWMKAATDSRHDVVVVDPPRAGLHPDVAQLLAQRCARRIVYVSCNIAAAARDGVELAREGWNVARVRPLDLFPHTPHVECILTLERRA